MGEASGAFPAGGESVTPELQEQLALLPHYLGNHLRLSVTAIVIGAAISLPLSIAATRIRRLEWPLVAVANVLQTIPALALLAFMVPLLGRIGFVPALIALVLYSMLPIVRNTITGIHQVDPSLVEAGRGLGMTDLQLLFRVQLPLAAPTILAGLRIAVVWVVGIATLSTPVGAPSLGNYIFSGLQTQNFTAVLVGVVSAALLALSLDGLIRLVEWAYRGRRTAAALTGILGLLGVLLLPAALPGPQTSAIRIGSKAFTEQYILAELIHERLATAGRPSRVISSLGSTVAFDALLAGQIDVYVDYSGTLWANRMKRTDIPPRDKVLREMTRWLEKNDGVRCLGSLGFENAYALAMTKKRVDTLDAHDLSQLAQVSSRLTIGGDYEFFSRPEWKALQHHYGFSFRSRTSFDPSLMYQAVASGQVDVISAFTTDGRIEAFHLTLLQDDRHALPPYDAVLLVSPQRSGDRRLIEALRPLVGSITNSQMRGANGMVDLEGRPVRTAAEWLSRQIVNLKSH
jgi:osmoprotectant transport system permease protein